LDNLRQRAILVATAAEAVEDPVMAAVLGGMDPLQAIMAGGGALPANCQGVPWNGGYIVASGNLLADFRANAAAEAQGRLQTARLYNMTDDPGVKAMLQFNLARDTVHQKQWLKAIEELEADGLETPIVPNAFFDEEDQVHNRTIWGLSDGTDGPKGGWTEGDDPLEYLLDPEPLGGPGTAPAPDPALFGTYSTVQDVKGTVKAKVQAAKKSATRTTAKTATKSATKTADRTTAKKSAAKKSTAKKSTAKKTSKSSSKR
jgi:Mn-containing catalase